jgi:hypothetical protein
MHMLIVLFITNHSNYFKRNAMYTLSNTLPWTHPCLLDHVTFILKQWNWQPVMPVQKHTTSFILINNNILIKKIRKKITHSSFSTKQNNPGL